jgi:hypothetical protein
MTSGLNSPNPIIHNQCPLLSSFKSKKGITKEVYVIRGFITHETGKKTS